MTIHFEMRSSDSPYLESVTRGETLADGAPIRPAEEHWHLVFVQHQAETRTLLVGPWTSAGKVSYGAGAQILWVKFKLGAWFDHLPIQEFVDSETALPDATGPRFWLKSATWEIPTFDNVETFVSRLAHEDALRLDPVVQSVLQGDPPSLSPRTVRHRFLHATGMTQKQIQQMARARRAADLLHQGTPILDAVAALGYYDQPHLTRSLKHWIGHTPAQIAQG
jgi:hypothetical protein